MEKEKFTIFLDFDGVLNDLTTIPKIWNFGGLLVGKNDHRVFNEESMEALNMLMDTLEHKYDVEIVLTTFWRRNLSRCYEFLTTNGIKYLKGMQSIPMFARSSRASQVKKYLEANNREKFLILDDSFSAGNFIKEENIIETNIVNGALSISSVINYIDTFQKDLSPFVPIKNIDFERGN